MAKVLVGGTASNAVCAWTVWRDMKHSQSPSTTMWSPRCIYDKKRSRLY